MLKSKILASAAILTTLLTPASADTFVVRGFIQAPSGPDTNPAVYGYDNGGYFGNQFANLGGLPFTISWTGTPCDCYSGAITGANLTINGITVDFLAYGGLAAINQSEWLTNLFNRVIQVQTRDSSPATAPPFAETFYGSQNTLVTWDPSSYAWPDSNGKGVFYLQDYQHQFQTSAFLEVTNWNTTAVPSPIAGAGLPGLIALLLWWRGRRRVV